jgi:DNA-binding beta-propeller fold protein YncE
VCSFILSRKSGLLASGCRQSVRWQIHGLLSLGLFLFAQPVFAGLLYWTVATGIESANTDGTNRTTVISGLTGSRPMGIAVNDSSGHIFWTEFDASDIHRADFSGNNIVTLLDVSLFQTAGISVDAANNRMYWGEVNRLARDDINPATAANPTTVHVSGSFGVAQTSTHVYWNGGTSSTTIRRVELNGANPTTIVANGGNGWGIAADETNGFLYWANRTNTSIERSDLNGGNRITLIDNANTSKVTGITLDIAGDRMYWLNSDNTGGNIFEANLAGANQQSIATLTGPAEFIAFSTVSTPEPSSLVLALVSGGAFLLTRWRQVRRRNKSECPAEIQLAA